MGGVVGLGVLGVEGAVGGLVRCWGVGGGVGGGVVGGRGVGI